jgi:hypothetical protein
MRKKGMHDFERSSPLVKTGAELNEKLLHFIKKKKTQRGD